jgi:hypothetical protein
VTTPRDNENMDVSDFEGFGSRVGREDTLGILPGRLVLGVGVFGDE